jgi:NADH dehydrogenase FAD-containing subunit
VEIAAALAIAIRSILHSESRRIDPTLPRIVLVDAAPKLLGSFAPELSAAAKERLEKLGVEVRLGGAVEKIDEEGVVLAGERLPSKTVIWTAGVAPSPAGKWLGVETDRAGRVRVRQDLRVPGYPEIFVIGDTASLEQDGKPLPGVAQVAMQQGRYVGRLISRRIAGRNGLKPFRYFDKGNMAVVGKGFAVLQADKIRMHGVIAWLAWAMIHIAYLAHGSLRISVLLQWLWTFFTGQRRSRLIIERTTPLTQN